MITIMHHDDQDHDHQVVVDIIEQTGGLVYLVGSALNWHVAGQGIRRVANPIGLGGLVEVRSDSKCLGGADSSMQTWGGRVVIGGFNSLFSFS